VVAERHPAVVGDRHDVLGPVAGGAVVPDDRLQHEHHAGRQDLALVERLAEVGADQRHLGAVGADAVGEVEVLDPRPATAAVGGVGCDGGPGQVQRRYAGLAQRQHRLDHRAPPGELRLLPGGRAGVVADDPGAAEVRGVPAHVDAGVHPDHVTVRQRAWRAGEREGDVAVDRPRAGVQRRRHRLPDRVDAVGVGAQLDHPAQEPGAEVGLGDARAQQRRHVEHRGLVDRLRPPDARQLVGGLAQLGRPQHARRGDQRPVRQGSTQRVRHLVAPEPGAGREQIPQRRG
jgi:hypothetical protein